MKVNCKHGNPACDQCVARREKNRAANALIRSMSLADLVAISNNVNDRFWSKVDVMDDDQCWPWLAAKQQNDYGIFCLRDSRTYTAHVLARALTTGDYDVEGYEHHHDCRNHDCVNPAHVQKLTPEDHDELHRQLKAEEDA